MWRRAARQLWMVRLDEPADVERALRHPALADRAAIENSLSRLFFQPFVHQEVAVGAAFAARARWSQRALSRLPDERVVDAAHAAFTGWRPRASIFPSLLEEVRRVSLQATLRLAFGSAHASFERCALAAVTDFDHAIKMMARPLLSRRLPLQRALRQLLAEPQRWPSDPCYLSVARSEALALPLQSRVDHCASVLLGTGTIQVSDVVTHALIALAQHPGARRYDDAAVVRETMRAFPVNASVSRLASADIQLDQVELRRGEAITVVPMRFNRNGWRDGEQFDPGRWQRERGADFAFGHGPRGCPARRVALLLTETLLGLFRRELSLRIEPGYPHRRSLARPLSFAVAEPGQTPPEPAAAIFALRHWTRYARTCAHTYPRALLQALPEMIALVCGPADTIRTPRVSRSTVDK